MDVMLYALVLGEVQREMHLSAAMSGAMMSATLISAALAASASAGLPTALAASARSPQRAGLFVRHGDVRLHADGRRN